MSSGTIFGQPQGKWMVGSIAPQGSETALSGKWIGENPSFTYPALSVQMPERVGVSIHPIFIVLALKYLYSKLKK